MRTAIASSLAVAALAAFPGAALARPKPVTGSLGAKGYTLIALGYNGKASSVQVKGKFKLVPPAKKFTLHLRAANGKYAGPVVVGGKGKLVIVGLKGGAKLGKLKLGRGFARPAKALPASMIDKSRTAKARKGVPVGAGVYGLVKSATKAAVSNAGADPDHDGVPNAFDVDDNGNLVMDNQDPVTGLRARKAQGLQAPSGGDTFQLFSNFHFDVSKTLNANAAGVTKAEIDAALTSPDSFVGLVFPVPSADSVELDCGGLSYCSLGGTGFAAEPFPNGQPFPACCDQDGDGLGTIDKGPTGDFQLRARATSDKIGSGDTFIERVTIGGVEHDLTGVLNYIFNTIPAVKSYSDGSGAVTDISYPVPSNGPGTMINPIALHPGPDGDLSLTLTFWRPQRSAIAGTGEGGGFVDIGGLNYQVNVPNSPVTQGSGPGGAPARGPQTCGFTALSTTDPNLTPAQAGQTLDAAQPYSLRDTAPDRPADPANTLTLKVDFTKCFGQAGQTLQPGQSFGFELQAMSNTSDNGDQGFTACFPRAGETTCAGPGGPAPTP
jgi:hypothetical protein